MLGKLLKYEIKATARTFLPMYALLIVFALINKFFMAVNADYLRIPRIIAMSVFVVVIVGICVMTLIVTIQRFNKNLLTDEGYLSFTLPVKAHTHIDSKMIVSLMWSLLSVIVSFIAIFVMYTTIPMPIGTCVTPNDQLEALRKRKVRLKNNRGK